MLSCNDNVASVQSLIGDFPTVGTIVLPMGSLNDLDPSRPVNLISPKKDKMDPTTVCLDDGDTFEARQTAADGTVHVLLMSRDMVIEMMGLMNAWVSLG